MPQILEAQRLGEGTQMGRKIVLSVRGQYSLGKLDHKRLHREGSRLLDLHVLDDMKALDCWIHHVHGSLYPAQPRDEAYSLSKRLRQCFWEIPEFLYSSPWATGFLN